MPLYETALELAEKLEQAKIEASFLRDRLTITLAAMRMPEQVDE